MGCGLCAPKAAQYKSSAVSPSGQSVGKAFSEDAQASASRVRPDSWRAGREAPVTASDVAEEAAEGPREGPRDAAEAEPSAQVDLPGMPEGKAAESSPEPEAREAKEAAKTEIQAKDKKCEAASAGVQVPAVRPKSSPKAKASSPKATSSPTEAKEDSSDESVDEEEMEATLRAVASVLTPRRQSEEGKVLEASVPLPPPRKVSAVSAQLAVTARSTRPLYEITSPMSKPQVDNLPFPSVTVSTSTQLLLLKWARWGRNNCRIKQEEQIKSMQHRRFPRSPPPVQLSPQPTPRESTPRGSASGGASPDSSPPRTGAAAWRAGGELGMGTTVHSREGGSPGRAFDLAELREDQRDSMAQQGTRMKLTRGLGGGAALAHSLGTPGFGVDTPGFPGGSGSGVASADASVVSSGVASPVKGGVMSPWILEAEALCEETEDEGSPGGGGWGLEPEIDTLLMLEQEILGKRSHAVELRISKDSLQPKEEDQPVLDEDELHQVELFEESPSKKSVEAASERWQETPSSEPHQVPEDLSSALTGFEYVIGEQVSYYSASHGACMPAKIVERKSRTIYVIDKQMRGCLAKVRASELVSEKEEKSNPVLRAFTMLEKSEKKQKKRPSSARSSTSASSKPRSATPAAPAVTVPGRGRIVRDDFSDEDD